ncbi:uncharacterized protein LOC124426567 [Vespa crabro]|uniref:uncharacterized protein LOC124426567 n=1 Tax=Vespa crabro TaxID=7445 RepID=UPI001F01EF41|nr:uncharacterized protein LOC124426567 [Vespa crabro]
MVEMLDWEYEDPLTKLNTQLNKSMVLIENVNDHAQSNKSNKTIKIKTKSTSPKGNTSMNGTYRKSILKKSESINNEERNVKENVTDTSLEVAAEMTSDILTIKSSSSSRPQNLQDLMKEETLTMESASSCFNFDDISDNEDIWIMDIPKTIDPQKLIGQTLVLGDKSKFRIGEEKYCAVKRDLKQDITCVFGTGKINSQYKAVNIKPAGSITIRRKLSSVPKIKPILLENLGVPFPENLKTRHPLLGVVSENKSKKVLRMSGSSNKKRKS